MLLGLAVPVFGVYAACFLKRGFMGGRPSRAWLFTEIAFLVVGFLLGIAAVAYSRYPTPDTRLLGFPFVAAVFERSPTGGWVDFVGPRTYFATIGNFVIGLFLPRLLFATLAWLSHRRTNAA